MVQQRQQMFCYSVVIGLVVALASTFMACDFHAPDAFSPDTPEGINAILNMAPVRSLSEGDRWTVYEAPGKIRVQHGYGCSWVDVAATTDYIGLRIHDMAEIPLSFADAGIIILNGWDVQYPNGDHHVQGLGSAIFNITETHTVDQFALHWDAGGVLSDKNGNDGYKWCYRYTLVFWKRNAINAVVPPQTDLSTTFVTPVDTGTTLLNLPGEFTDPSYGPRAVLPRGFGLSWAGTDHHVFQVGFDLGTPIIAGNAITWTSQTIWRDISTDLAYDGAELVTILSGQSVKMWQPPTVLHLKGVPPDWVEEPTELNLSPEKPLGCHKLTSEEHLEFYSVEKVPFDYAVPLLTGWDLSYVCDDHHVERVGVYLVEFEYVKNPNAPTGTLNYTIFSTLRDDSDNGHAAKYKVSILGLNALGGKSPKLTAQKVTPTLAPYLVVPERQAQ